MKTYRQLLLCVILTGSMCQRPVQAQSSGCSTNPVFTGYGPFTNVCNYILASAGCYHPSPIFSDVCFSATPYYAASVAADAACTNGGMQHADAAATFWFSTSNTIVATGSINGQGDSEVGAGADSEICFDVWFPFGESEVYANVIFLISGALSCGGPGEGEAYCYISDGAPPITYVRSNGPIFYGHAIWEESTEYHTQNPVTLAKAVYTPLRDLNGLYVSIGAWGGWAASYGYYGSASYSVSITVFTNSCTCTLSPTNGSYGVDGGSGIIGVSTSTTDCVWAASCDAEWVTITAPTNQPSTGPGTVGYSVAPNCSANSRTATLSVNDQTFTVTQAGATISPTSAYFDSDGGLGAVALTTGANCSWTAVSQYNWVTFPNGASGTGPATVAYAVAANTDCNPRTNTLTIAGFSFTIIQAGATEDYTIRPTSAIYSATGGSGSVNVTASSQGCQWFAVSLTNWITVTSGGSGTGDGTVNYAVAANASCSPRTGQLSIAGNTFTVTQAGGDANFTIDPPGAEYGFAAALGSVDVQAGYTDCVWSASSDLAWVTILPPASGAGNGTVNYFVAANASVIPRSGYITVAGLPFAISQDGVSICTYMVSPSTATCNAGTNGGTVSVTTSNGCHWAAAPNASWLSISSGNSGTGNGTVGYLVAANTTTNWRNGTLTVAGRTVTVNQAGISNCTYTISTSASPLAGGSTSGGGAVGCGSNTTVRATANVGYCFLRWTEGGTNVSTAAHYTFKATANRNLVAIFATPPVITTTNPLPAGATGTAYNQTLQATNGTLPYTWSVFSNSLPTGLSLSPSNGRISGTPAIATNAVLTVMVADMNQLTATQAFSLAISVGPLQVAPAPLPAATQNARYNAPLQALGGQPPYTWSLAPGSAPLPFGLSLAPNGTLSGIACAAGTSCFIVNVTDALNATTTQVIAITVNPSSLPLVVSITGPSVLANGQFQFTVPAAAGTNYTVLFSTDLVTWTPILTFTGSGTPETIIDPSAPGSHRRFYRVRVQ